MDRNVLDECVERLDRIRSEILTESPFYGRLLMALTFSIGRCGTAATDMKRIIYDPSFIGDMQHDELKFIMLHELMHCVLQHPARGKDLDRFTYNVACDIVVNSLIMGRMPEVKTINGEAIMHLTPKGEEGSRYTAEQVYEQLLQNNNGEPLEENEGGYYVLDLHDIWECLRKGDTDVLAEVWRCRCEKLIEEYGQPEDKWFLRRAVDYNRKKSGLNWLQILHDYLLQSAYDYTYALPDRRFQGDFIMPSYQVMDSGQVLDNVWICIDTSGSVSREELSQAYTEIINIIEQVGEIKGKVSFFEDEITEPVEIEGASDIRNLEPLGMGGTNFHRIFDHLGDFFASQLPSLTIIMTDGYATFPDESMAQDVPVMWVIIGNEEVKPPWGMCVYVMEADGQE